MRFILILFLIYSCASKEKQIKITPIIKIEKREVVSYHEPLIEYPDDEIIEEHDNDELLDKEINNYFDLFLTQQEKDFFDVGELAPDISITFIYPLKHIKISSTYGNRIHPLTKKHSFHKGVDFKAKEGTNIIAVQTGTVIISKFSPTYGNIIAISHSGGLVSLYGHNKVNLVKKGDTVQRNQIIALVGNTGKSTGSHLHFELRRNKQQLDPIKFLNNQNK